MTSYDYDIVIVGAGPAGSICALYAARHGLRTLLLDKKVFPRDKICGDAISGISLRFLQELGLQDKIEKAGGKKAKSMLLFAPDGSSTKISFTPEGRTPEHFNIVCRRTIFDNILFQQAKQHVDTLEGFTVTDLLRDSDQVCGIKGLDANNTTKKIRAKVVIGADGCRSVVARKAGLSDFDSRHQVVATRTYYENVTQTTKDIELHFIDEVIPGYFWIFPIDDNQVNVGLGMLHSELIKRKINLRTAHIQATRSPRLGNRFKNAVMLGPIRGWNLPLAHKRRKMTSDGVLLIGDAAGLVHPLSGEGISFSMLSGYLAAELLSQACAGNDFSTTFLQQYQTKLWNEVCLDFRGGAILQKVGTWKPFINRVIRKAEQNKTFNNMISQLLAGEFGPGALANPKVILRLFFS